MSYSKSLSKIHIPAHIRRLRAYEPGKSGEDAIPLSSNTPGAILCSNENNLGPSPKAIAAMEKALKESAFYPDPTGIQLRRALADTYGISPDQIALGNGSDELLYNLLHSMCEADDVVLTAQNSFISVNVFTSLFQIPLQTVPLKAGYTFDLDVILAHITPHTKIIYLCNPNNPTGTLFDQQAFQQFLQKVPDHILVVVDEAYAEYAQSLFDDYPQTISPRYPNVLVLRTFSKAYGLAGVRIGYAIGAEELITVLMKVKPIFSVNAIAQAGALAALTDSDYLAQIVDYNKSELAFFYKLFERLQIDHVPSFGNFVMIDLHNAHHAEVLNKQLEIHDVKVRRLHAFGLPHCLRISVGTEAENRHFGEQLTHIWKQDLATQEATL